VVFLPTRSYGIRLRFDFIRNAAPIAGFQSGPLSDLLVALRA
jgi:hypothetical protein